MGINDAITQAQEGIRMFRRAQKVKREGFRKYSGTPEQMCRKIIEESFNKKEKYFMVSSGHFQQFYVRDFAYNAKALIALGYGKEVRLTLIYALEKFSKEKRITTTITPQGKPFDFSGRGPESIALFIHTIRITKNTDLCKKYKNFLQKQVDDVAQNMIDKKTLLPREDKEFQSPRDQVTSPSSCYNACMIAMLAEDAQKIGLSFPWKKEKIKKKIIQKYWNGKYFFNDSRKQELVLGDANTFPFWTGVIDEKKILKATMTAIHSAELDEPYPLQYINSIDKHKEKRNIHLASLFSPDYMTDTRWMHLGLAYLEVLIKHDKKRTKRYLQAYTQNLLKHRTFLEVYSVDGNPYETPFYVSDEAMIWCATYLWLAKKIHVLD